MDIKPITIAGCGPGSIDLIPPAVHTAVAHADLVAGTQRLLDQFPSLHAEKLAVGSHIAATLETLAEALTQKKKIVVLVTGDPGLCSLARPVLERFGKEKCRIIPGISSVHAAFAAAGLEWTDARILSAHDKAPSLAPALLKDEARLAVLAGNPRHAEWIESLVSTLAPSHQIWACENLSLPEESVRLIDHVRFADLASRTVLLFIKKDIQL